MCDEECVMESVLGGFVMKSDEAGQFFSLASLFMGKILVQYALDRPK